MKEKTTGKAKPAVTALMLLGVLLSGFYGGVFCEKGNTKPIVTFYRAQVDEYYELVQQHDRTLQEKTAEADAWRQQYNKALIVADSYKKSREELQNTLERSTYQLDAVSNKLNVTQQERDDLLIRVKGWEEEGYVPFLSESEIAKYVNSTGLWQREYVPTTYDCDDFAIDLAVRAYKDRRMIGLWGYPSHLQCFAIMGNYIYGVEPQANWVVKLARLD